ncbi:MAG TPA: magnesium/cobalt transporter CorA [Longimicrobiaceae bacterium]|nr:magnesium/cobalt transporter CorA [Longimicrobiaceae bacterium]
MHKELELDPDACQVVDAPEPQAEMRAWSSGAKGIHAVHLDEALRLYREKCGPGVERASEGEGQVGEVVWIDVVSPGDKEAVFLRDTLRFHPLAVEDCIRGRQRPKVDRYPGYFFLVLYAGRINTQGERSALALNEVHVFLGERFVVTVHDKKVQEVGEVVARWRAAPGRLHDTGTLAHALLDAVVDAYFPVLDHFSERVEEIEDAMLADRSEGDGMQGMLALRRELTIFRRVVAPQRDVLTTLLRRDIPFLRPELVPYIQDVQDHVMRVTEEIDGMRELLASAVDAYLSSASNRLNHTMRVMAAWSIILMAMAWIAGVYGMNFHVMPELGWRYGYAWALGAMFTVGGGLFMFFRRWRWI